MANKVQLRAKRKNLDHLRCEFKIYAKPFGVLEAEMQHKDKYCVGAFPTYGYPCPAGVQMDFGDCSKDVPYKELTKNVCIPELLRIVGLETVPLSAARIITPEEYDERYGDDE